MSTTYTINQVTGYTGEGDTQEPVVKTHHVTLDELADLLEDGRAAEALVENGRLGEHDVWTVARVEVAP